MKQHELDGIVQQANECHRKTVANKDSWLVVPKDKEEAALALVDALDCRSEEGVTVGLIDALITVSRVLAHRDFTLTTVVEALKDLADDEDVKTIMDAAKHSKLCGEPLEELRRRRYDYWGKLVE